MSANARVHTPSTPEREVVLRADFDLIDDDGCMWISTRFFRGPSPPAVGDVVYLLDGDGRGCVGNVRQVHGWYVCACPDWSTWTGGPLPSRHTNSASDA